MTAPDMQSQVTPALPAQPLSDPREAAKWSRLRLRHFTPSGTGVNIPVAAGSVSLAVVFARQESNTDYGVLVLPGWDTTVSIPDDEKSTSGFTVYFGSAPGTASALQWSTHRSEDS